MDSESARGLENPKDSVRYVIMEDLDGDEDETV